MIQKIKILVAVLASCMLLSGCADLKSAGRSIGYTTKKVTRNIGHGTRDAVKSVGKATKEAVKWFSNAYNAL